MKRSLIAVGVLPFLALAACSSDGDDKGQQTSRDAECLVELGSISPIESLRSGGTGQAPVWIDGVAYFADDSRDGPVVIEAHGESGEETFEVTDPEGPGRAGGQRELLGQVEGDLLLGHNDGEDAFLVHRLTTDGTVVWTKESPRKPRLIAADGAIRLDSSEFIDAATGKALPDHVDQSFELLPIEDGADDALLLDRSSGVWSYMDTEFENHYLTAPDGEGDPWVIPTSTPMGLCGDNVYLVEGTTLKVFDLGSHDEPLSEIDLGAEPSSRTITVSKDAVAVDLNDHYAFVTR